jgi:hypothetical protein
MSQLGQYVTAQQQALNQQMHNQQQNQNPAHNTVSKALSTIKLPEFTGEKDKVDLDTWLFQSEQYFTTLSQVTDAQKIQIASLQLRGHAAAWWRDVSQHAADKPATWDDFKKRIMSVYMPVLRDELARDRLAVARQHGSLDAYVAYMRSLYYAIPDITESEKMDRFKRGLKPHLLREVVVSRPKPTSFEEMVTIAALHDSLQRSTQWSSRFPQRQHESSSSREHGKTGPTPMELGAVSSAEGKHTSKPNKTNNSSNEQHKTKHGFKKSVKCYNCGRKGHIARECPDPPKERRQENGGRRRQDIQA